MFEPHVWAMVVVGVSVSKQNLGRWLVVGVVAENYVHTTCILRAYSLVEPLNKRTCVKKLSAPLSLISSAPRSRSSFAVFNAAIWGMDGGGGVNLDGLYRARGGGRRGKFVARSVCIASTHEQEALGATGSNMKR